MLTVVEVHVSHEDINLVQYRLAVALTLMCFNAHCLLLK